MANNFTSVQQNQASKKFSLVRIKPARYMNDDLVNTSGTEYEATMPFTPVAVEQDGVALTEVSGTPSPGEWSYSGTTLTINTTTPPSSSSAVVAFYYIFLTGERFRVLGQDPETPLVDLRDWEPKLLRSPSVNYDISNVIYGTLSINSSALTFINDNDDFNKYLTDNDSFYKKEIEIWQCLDSTDNIKKLFFGVVTEVQVDRTRVQLRIEDDYSKLDAPALMGDEQDTAYFSKSGFANIAPGSTDLPIFYFFGRVSRYQLEGDSSIASLADAQRLDPSSMSLAACTSFSTTTSTTTNREWGICRTSSNGFEDFSFTPSAVNNVPANHTELTGTATEIDKFFVGDTFQTSDTEYGRVLKVDRGSNILYTTKLPSITTSSTVQGNNCPSIAILDPSGQKFYPLYGRDYTATTVSLSSTNTYLDIDFTNNFEATLSMGTLDPQAYQVFFRVHPDNSEQLHGTVMNEILQKAGVTVNAASITAANAAFNVNANFSIPFFDESEFSEYYRYVEEILQSVLGVLFINNDFEMVYELLATPSGTTTIEDTDILEDTYRVDIEYKDIVTQIIAFNPHYSSSEVNGTSSATGTSTKAQYLHSINRVTRFRHVLEDYTSKINDQIGLRSERLARYRFSTKQINFLSEINDDLTLMKLGIPGQASSRSIKIFRLNKKVDETGISATDLLGL